MNLSRPTATSYRKFPGGQIDTIAKRALNRVVTALSKDWTRTAASIVTNMHHVRGGLRWAASVRVTWVSELFSRGW